MKNFGFGCMRLPMWEGEVDYPQFCEMIDRFMESGFTYFDTAHGYIQGKSEIAIRECLAKRYPRENYVLTDKLTHPYFEKAEDIRPFFESQLEACGVEYFDYYLIHSVTKENYDKYNNCRAFEIAQELKNEGKVKHIGMSFHDTPEFLEEVFGAENMDYRPTNTEFFRRMYAYILRKRNTYMSIKCPVYKCVRCSQQEECIFFGYVHEIVEARKSDSVN